MAQDLGNTIALLERGPRTLDALLRNLPEAWTHRNEGEGTWTVFETVGHMIHCERTDWMQRARIILQDGESRPFDKVDRLGLVRETQGKLLGELLDTFARLRGENLAELRGLTLTPEDLERRGMHPAFGPVTLGQLLATWSMHDLTHLHQISRILAHQYREEVGPWNVYLGVMQCNGHSA